MANRQDNRSASGPLSAEELEAIFERGYSINSRRFLAQAWDQSAEAPALFEVMNDPEAIAAALDAMEDLHEQALLGEVAAKGGRARAENVRKELLLRGQGDTSQALRALIQQGLAVVLPRSGQSALELEALLEQGGSIQQELVLVPALIEALEERGIARRSKQVGAWDGEIVSSRKEALQALELNVLELSTRLVRDVLRLNKSGAPNRRSLTKFIEGLTRPAESNTPEPWLDVDQADQSDYLSFLFALVRELGVSWVDEDEQTLRGNHARLERHFGAEADRRGRELLRAVQNLKGWSEALSLGLASGMAPEDLIEEQLSQHRDNGAALIGARGHVISTLRRAHLSGWTPMASIIELCTLLDRDYLPRVLERAGEEELDVSTYVRSIIERPLFWMGLVELGTSAEGVELMRLTEAGEALLADGELGEQGVDGAGCLVVQPNYEIMAFLDGAPMMVLFRLYQIGDRINLADRVATFKLTAESVQRGYSLGMRAEQAAELLDERSHAPLPEAIRFELENWERVWRRVSLWARGTLLRHEDPDRLDTIVGLLRHSWRDREVTFERLSAGSIFIDTIEGVEDLQKQLDRYDGLLIDYLGEIPPALEFVEPLVISWAPMHCDIITRTELARVTTERKDQCTPRRRVAELMAAKLRVRWPEDTLARALEFFDQRTRGGLPPEQALRMRALLEDAPTTQILEEMIVMELEDELTADLFARVPEAGELITARLGPRAFAIPSQHAEALTALLERVGVRRQE